MNAFEYARPATLEAAIALRGETWDDSELLAGGSDLLSAMKQDLVRPARVISLRDIAALRGVSESGDAIRIGATTTLGALSENSVVREEFPALLAAAQSLKGAQMQAQATIGGNLCQRPRCWYFRGGHGLLARENGEALVPGGDNRYHAIFGNDGPAYFVNPSSLAPVLMTLDARLEIAGPDGASREVALAEFYRTPQSEEEREYDLGPRELLTAVVIPRAGLKNGVYDIRHREGLDWPYVTAAVAFRAENGDIADARVVLGHVAPVPWPAPAAARALEGGPLDEARAAEAGEAAVEGARPLSGNAYKVTLVKTAVKRAAARAGGMTEV